MSGTKQKAENTEHPTDRKIVSTRRSSDVVAENSTGRAHKSVKIEKVGKPNSAAETDHIITRSDAQWYKDAIIYELHPRAFFDSDADGIGNFTGLTQKLPYLQELGITAIWLLPFYVSPQRDDGYDIADYTAINPAYGTLRDFKKFLNEAHKRGLKVITELVLNHTSDEHPWFQRARRAEPGSNWRNFYTWSDTPERYSDARVIFRDFEASNWSWDPVAQAYYWHRFYSHQPDLNYDNPAVRKAMFKVVDFWLKMGVDGLRLDAVPYLYEREGTTGENLPETHEFLKQLRTYVDQRYPDRMLLAEANQWPEESVAYFGTGEGNECHMAFHFPLMPRLFMALRREDRLPIIDILAQTPPIPGNAQWALFLRNHDELTLEMVTDADRLYMYRAYAHDPEARINVGIRRRLAPLLRNDRRRIELMNALLFSLPGTPVIYYGDEIGMGDNIYLGDRDGVRTPMQWSLDRNAGFSRANPQQLYLPLIVDHEYHYESVHVEAQQSNPHSLLAWMRRIISLRKRFQAFGRGSLEFLHPENRKVLTFMRKYEDERILVVANLSRFVQHVELDLSAYKDAVPVELFGKVPFPPITDQPYFVTLGPHSFYWFSLQNDQVTATSDQDAALPELSTQDGWEMIIRSKSRHSLEDVLPGYLSTRSWFRGNTHRMLAARVVDSVPLKYGSKTAHICVLRVDYADHDPETYVLPIGFAVGEQANVLQSLDPGAVIANLTHIVKGKHEKGILYDALRNENFARALLTMVSRRNHLHGEHGTITGEMLAPVRNITQAGQPKIVQGDLNNTSITFGDKVILKFFRCIDEGINPDVEIGEFLTEHKFKHTPPLLGHLDYKLPHGSIMTMAEVERYVPNEGDAWDAAQEELAKYFTRLADGSAPLPKLQTIQPLEESFDTRSLLELAQNGPSETAKKLIGPFLDTMGLLGKRTADLHLMLASDEDNKAFRPLPFTPYHQRSLYQAMRRLTSEVIYSLRRHISSLPKQLRQDAESLIGLEESVLQHFKRIYSSKIKATAIRCHGDYRLGQVLYTGGDFVFLDFEGEPGNPISERRLKQSPLKDIASMLRSLHYAAYAGYATYTGRRGDENGAVERKDNADAKRRDLLATYWAQQAGAAMLREYLKAAEGSSFIPQKGEELFILLDSFLLERMILELDYAAKNRPDLMHIPLRAILNVLKVAADGGSADKAH